jgi:hypothetical protein
MTGELDLLEKLYDALREPLGIVVETEDPERLRQRLYALRKARIDDDPQLRVLSFLISPTNPGSELWIVKAKQPNVED